MLKLQSMILHRTDLSAISEHLSNITDVSVCNLLFYAVHVNCDVEIIKMLVNAGADVNKLVSKLEYGKGTLLMGINCSDLKSIDNCKSRQIIDFIISRGFNLKAVNEYDDTIIHIVNCKYLIDMAIRHGVCIDAKNCYDCTPLTVAIGDKNYLKAKYLLELGANPNCIKFLFKKLDVWDKVSFKYDRNTLLVFVNNMIDLLFFHGASDLESFIVKINELLSKKKRKNFGFKYITNVSITNNLVSHYLLYVNENGLDQIVVNDSLKNVHLPINSLEAMIPPMFLKKSVLDRKLELEEMRVSSIKDGLTFYDFLYLKKLYKSELVDISFNEYRYSNEQINNVFPIYSNLIIMRVESNKLQKWNKTVKYCLEKIVVRPAFIFEIDTDLRLNYDVLFIIGKYLNKTSVISLLLASIES